MPFVKAVTAGRPPDAESIGATGEAAWGRKESPHVSEEGFQPERRRADTDTGRKTPRQAEACRGEGFSARLMDDAH